MTIIKLIELLRTLPPEATWEAYEGEASGIRIDSGEVTQVAFIHDGSNVFAEPARVGLEVDELKMLESLGSDGETAGPEGGGSIRASTGTDDDSRNV